MMIIGRILPLEIGEFFRCSAHASSRVFSVPAEFRLFTFVRLHTLNRITRRDGRAKLIVININ